MYKLITSKCKTDVLDMEGKKPADYIIDIEDEDVQQEVMQILDSN